MGTNYYLHIQPDFIGKLTDVETEILHIGKSSYGWCFALRLYPERGILNIRDWWKLLRRRVNTIYDEYGEVVSVERMINIIVKREGRPVIYEDQYITHPDRMARVYTQGRANGEKIILRAPIDGRHCVDHGGGPFDYIVGEFS